MKNIKDFLVFARRFVIEILFVLKPYMTFWAGLAVAAVVGILIFLLSYLRRYSRWDGYEWRKKATVKLLVFCLIETCLFLIVRILI